MIGQALEQLQLPAFEGHRLRAELGEETRPLAPVVERRPLGIDRIERRHAVDDELVGVDLAFRHDRGDGPERRVGNLSQRNRFVEVRAAADERHRCRRPQPREAVHERDLVEGVGGGRVDAVGIAVDDREPPRFRYAVVIARQVFRANVQDRDIFFLEQLHVGLAMAPA